MTKAKVQRFLKTWLVPYLIIAFVFFVMSACSPLYQHAYATTDFNVSMAISKAIGNGEIYFKDIFEQRGLYFYFLQIMSAFTSYYWAKASVWLLETINFFWLYRILRKIGLENSNKSDKFVTIIATILVAVIPFDGLMSNSAAPEEWCIVPIAYAILSLLRFVRNHKLSLKNSFILGLGMGWIIEIKYSNMMPIAGLFFGYGIYMLIKKQFKYFWQTVGVSVGGLLLMQIPAVVYFGVNHNIGKWLKGYFIDNGSSIDLSAILSSFAYYSFYLAPFLLLLSISIGLLFKQMDKAGRWVTFSTIIFSILGVALIGRTGVAYSLPILIIILGLGIPQVGGMKKWLIKAPKPFRILVFACLPIILGGYIASPIINQTFSTGTIRVFTMRYYKQNNGESLQYRASRLIDKYGGGSILTYGTITNTIYAYNKEYPKLYYFDQTTMSYKRYPQSFDTQNKYINEKKPVWVETFTSVTRIPKGMTAEEYNRQMHKIDMSSNSSKIFKMANVTAGQTYSQLHPDEFRKYPIQKIQKKDATYYLDLSLPKNLQRNYAMVFCGLGIYGDITKVMPTFGIVQFVWVRRDKLTEYPALQKQVINPYHVARALNRNNQ